MADHKFHCVYSPNARAGCKDSKCKQKIGKGVLRLARETPSPFSDDGTMMKWYHATCFFRSQTRVRKGTRKLESMEDFEEEPELEDADVKMLQRLMDGEKLWETTDASAFVSMKETPELLGALDADDADAQVGQKRSKKQAAGNAKRQKTASSSDALDGVRVALSGKVDGHTQSSFAALIATAGGTLSKTLTKTCEALIVGQKGEGTSKYNKAVDMEIPIVTPQWAIDSVEQEEKKSYDDYLLNGDDDEAEAEAEEEEEEKSEEEEEEEMDDGEQSEAEEGAVAVDDAVPDAGDYTVASVDDMPWHAYTRQATKKGHKYYLLQLLKSDGDYSTFFKWGAEGGRVSGTKHEKHASIEAAKKFFQKQFKAKTKNAWPVTKADFEDKGKYLL